MQQHLRAYRDELKGLAILWVVFFHAQLGLSGVLGTVQKIGYGGVDVFLFLSGFGLYHSLEQSQQLGPYLKRRALRLLPAYLPFCLLWLCVMLPLYGLGTVQSVRMAMGNLFMLGYFAGVPMINWYVSALAVSLLVAPVLHAVLHGAKRLLVTAAVLLSVCFAIGLTFVGTDSYMAVSRLPIFVLGMLTAMPQKKPLGWKRSVFLGLACFGGGLCILLVTYARFPELLNTYGMYWHPFVLIVPPLCAGLGVVLHKLNAGRFFAPLRCLGRASFEIFLFNAWVEVLGKKFGLAHTPVEWAMWSLISIAVGCAYHWVVVAACKRVAAHKNGVLNG